MKRNFWNSSEAEFHSQPLPWHRVVNREGKISLPRGRGFELQRELLEKEGVIIEDNGRVNLEKYLWLASGIF